MVGVFYTLHPTPYLAMLEVVWMAPLRSIVLIRLRKRLSVLTRLPKPPLLYMVVIRLILDIPAVAMCLHIRVLKRNPRPVLR